MSVSLHTSDELHQRSGAKHHQSASRDSTMPAAGVDADGLRCEVRSMRSVPHALYTLPSVAHVVAGYVRQLQDDFSSSLLLCRPAQRRVYSASRDNKEGGGKSSVTVAAGASVEEEEAYLLLRLCALEARQRRQRRRAGHRPQQQQNERAAAVTANGGRTSAARADSAPATTSMEDESDEEAAGCDGLWADAAATRNAKAHKDGVSHLQATLTEVDAQLLEMFAKAEAVRRRGGGEDGSSGGTVLGLPTSALTPPLLSSLLRFKPLLRDMQLIARHVLLPRYAWPHHQREWVNVCEDVSVTLCDRLARYRNVLCSSNNNVDEEKEAWGRTAQPTRRRVVSADELERLWQTLWELLGAAWRQRDRLWGAYRYMQGPRQLPPLSLNGQAVLAVPPGVHASPILRDHHLRHLIHTAAMTTSSSGNSGSGGGGAARAPAGPKLPPSLVAAHDEDSCGFGPFTSSDVGISAEARFVLRQPMAAALRLLRVCVPAAGRDALATSTSAFAGFKYVSEPVRRSQSPATSPAPASTSSSAAAPPPVVVPLFDPTEEDVRLCRAVPYMAPEVYLAQQLRQSDTAPVHRFSDDVWNTAVVVLEAALCGFAVGDPAQCHLSALTTPATADDRRRGVVEDEEEKKEEASRSDGSPDAMPPPSPPAAAVLGVPTDSVYADVLAVLASHHRVSQAAAHNFLYAALHHLQKALKALLVDGVEGEDARCGRDATSRGMQKQGEESATGVPPSPAVLAQEWVRYLCTHYDTDFVTRVLAGEVAARGLCWRRSERWNAFGMAHVTAATAPSPRAEVSSSSPLVAPPSPFGSACSESGSSWRGQRSAAAVHAPDALTSPSAVAPAVVVAEEAGSVSAADAPGRAFRLRPPLTVTLPSRLDSISSLDVSLRSPLHCGSPTSATSPTVARLPQRLDRAVNSMDTPLMPLFGVPAWTDSSRGSSGGGGSDRGEGLWVRLARFLRRRTASGKHQRTQQTNNSSSGSGSGGGAGGKANGAVADAADVDAVEEFLHLLYTCVCVALRRGDDDDAGKEGDDGGRTRFAAVNHPFLRGVAERGLLTTYMAVCGCARDEEGQRRTHETALQLYVPTRALLVAMAQLEEEEGEQQEAREGGDRLAVAADIIASLDQLVKRTGTLRTFIGDDVRAWEAARDVSRRERAAYPTYFSYAASMAQPPAPVRRARPAVEAVLTPMDLSLPVQLRHVAALQRLCLEAHGGDTASASVMGSGGSAAHATQQVRAYLHSAYLPTACGGISPFFAVPPTIRGAVWGCLLHVPPARKREAVFAHALQRTAAKPSLNDRQLAVDIPRCHAYHPLLSSARGSAQLQRLLRAWLFLHPRFAYWQGLDSVCAVLLTVSPHDEALVLAQLSAVVEQFIAHDEGGEEGLGSRSSLLQSPPLAQQQQQQQSSVATKPSMSDQLHRLTAVLRYCDPLLAHYLFSVLSCTPELYAISWLLTVFSHSLPTRKVYLLWDLLFSYGTGGGGSGTCLVALCAAVVMHRRSRLLSCDFTGCLSAFGSGAAHLDVAAAVGDTRQLMSVLPPSVLAQPCATEEESRTYTSQFLYSGGQRSATTTATVNAAQLPSLSVEDLKAAWDVARRRAAAGASTEQQQRQHWSDSGVYLVDVRPEAASDALLGAIHLPLQTASLSGGGGGLPPVLSGESFGSDTAERGEVSSLGGRRAQRRDDAIPAAGEGWGIVADQERLHEQQQLEREAQERHIADAAAELVRHLNNPAVAAIAPRGTEAVNTECTPNASGGGDGVLHGSPPWPVHPIVLKTSLAPHVVLVATGAVSYGSAGGFSSGGAAAAAADGEDVLLAHQLGLRLNACGVHNVSVLRGGAVAIRLAMPELVVPHSQRV